jgi:hypothetical protein
MKKISTSTIPTRLASQGYANKTAHFIFPLPVGEAKIFGFPCGSFYALAVPAGSAREE